MNAQQKSAQNDVHAIVTARMIEQLQIGVIPWLEQWDELPQYMNGYPMDYINALLLGSLPYPRKVFFTIKQIRRNKAATKRGEKGFPIVGFRHGKVQPTLYCTSVYHSDQLQGMNDDLLPARRTVRNAVQACEAVISAMPKFPKLIEVTAPTYYSLKSDRISHAARACFANDAQYYSSLFHALAASTGHPSRRNRDTAVHRAPDDPLTFSLEELIVEMVAGYLCNYTAIAPWYLVTHSDCDGWLRKLQTDKSMVITAAFYAQEAINYILNRNPLLNPIQTGVYAPKAVK
jgi:antirestriction protein ArdC